MKHKTKQEIQDLIKKLSSNEVCIKNKTENLMKRISKYEKYISDLKIKIERLQAIIKSIEARKQGSINKLTTFKQVLMNMEKNNGNGVMLEGDKVKFYTFSNEVKK
jgi:predicted  nucleic acid-binding Zn-ribbon protein